MSFHASYHPQGSQLEVTASSLKILVSENVTSRARRTLCSRLGPQLWVFEFWPGPEAWLGSLTRVSTTLRAQAEARIRDTQAKSAVIARSPLLGSSLRR